MFTMESRVRDVWNHPVGHDAITNLLRSNNLPKKLPKNFFLSRMKLSQLAFLSRSQLSEGFWKAFLELLNTGDAEIQASTIPISRTLTKRAWWKESVFYQIYPRSFADSNGDGIGDLRGIIEKLDYIKALGVDALWLSPIYDSPNDDNGYDIRDYEKIMEDFGTMEDFKELLEKVHGKGMKLIMDLVINHTSDEHEWFQKALADPSSKYRDYYFLLPSGIDENPPNNWISFFSGPAWNLYEEQKLWGLHLFSKKQMDLNWENAELRGKLIEMIKGWLAMGVDGFRMDVINLISKAPGLPDGDDTIGEMMGFRGIEHYFHGPKLHEYLRELRAEAFEPFKAFTVGETPGIGLESGKLFTSPKRKELDLIFSFDHLDEPGKNRFDDYAYDLNYLKKHLIDWTINYGDSWQSLFVENHDNPRITSKINPDHQHREAIAKLIGVLLLTIRGTPFIFQGQELGASNASFSEITDLRDVESLNMYQELVTAGESEEDAFAKVAHGTRDHSRVPMKWEENPPEKFWIQGSGQQLSVAQQEDDSRSVLNFYRKLLALRKGNLAFIYGKTTFYDVKRKDYFAYYRSLQGKDYFIECNLSDKPIKSRGKGRAIMATDGKRTGDLEAYGARIYLSEK